MKQQSRVLVVAQLPPPINGLTSMNASILAILTQATDGVVACDIGGGTGRLSPLRRVARTLGATVRLILMGRAKCVYMPLDGGVGLVLNVALALVARFQSARLYVHHHSFAYLNKRSSLFSLFLASAPATTTHIVLCPDMADQLRRQYCRWFGSSKADVKILSNAFALHEPAKHRASKRRPVTIGHLSNLTAEKGAELFLQLFRNLKDEGIQVRAVVAGPAHDPRIRRLLLETAALYPEEFEWLGAVVGSAKQAFFDSIDVFVFPTMYENEAQPLVLLEAEAEGLPCLTTSRGCIECDHAESGGFVAESAEQLLAQAVAWVRRANDLPSFLAEESARSLQNAREMREQSNRQLKAVIGALLC